MAALMTRMRIDDAFCRPKDMTSPALALAKLGAKAGLPPVGLPQPHLMVAWGWIKLDEPAGATRLVQEGAHVRLHTLEAA